MDDIEREPYFSKRIKLTDVFSPKECLGMMKRTIEVTIGNTEKLTTFKNPADVAEIKQQDLKEMILDLFKITDEIAVVRNFKFLDKHVRNT